MSSVKRSAEGLSQSKRKKNEINFSEEFKKLQEEMCSPASISDEEGETGAELVIEETGVSSLEEKAAWFDESDVTDTKNLTDMKGKKWDCLRFKDYQKVLEEKYESVMGVPKWAQPKTQSNEDTILTKTGNLLKKSSLLEKGSIQIQKVQDLNSQTYKEGKLIKSVLFHTTSTVGVVAGDSGIASIFQVDGKENAKLQSIKFNNFPISCTALLRNGEELIVGSRTYHNFYSHDLISGQTVKIQNNRLTDITHMKNFRATPDGKYIAVLGRFGNIYLLSSVSKEIVTCLKMNGDVSAIDFYGKYMYSHGTEGEVFVWDMDSRTCIHKFYDDGCLQGTVLSASPNGQLLACGSSSGVVNIYNTETILESASPKPLKSIFNLVTAVNSLKFNATSEVLCFSSGYKKNAIKLLHCPSMTVFSNFPSFQANFHNIQCIDFSPNSGFLAFGNNNGEANMYRLKYYGNY